MLLLVTSGDGCRGLTTSVGGSLAGMVGCLRQSGLDSRLDVVPRAHVQWFLLTPDNLGVGVLVSVLLDLLIREGVELLDTRDGDIGDTELLAGLEKGVVDLTRAEDVLGDVLGRGEVLGVGLGNVELEAAVTAHLLEAGAGQRVAEHGLGEGQDQRLAELAVDLATEDVEVLGRGGSVDDLHVAVLVLAGELLGRGVDVRVIIAQLEVTLNTRGRVLGALAVITVGEGHNETGTLEPLLLTRGEELIDNALRVVGKVTELSLPYDESVGVNERIAELKTKDAKLGERRVADGERALLRRDVVQQGVEVLVLLVVKDGVALREGTTLDILTGHADVLALKQKRAPSQGLGGGPVNVLAGGEGLAAVLDNTVQVAVNGEVLGEGGEGLADLLEGVDRNGGGVVGQDLLGAFLGRLEAGPRGREPLARGRLVVLAAGIAVLEDLPHALLVGLNILGGQGAFRDKLVLVLLGNRFLLGDGLVHAGLGEAGLVSLVVTVLTVADKVDDNVTVEGLAPVSRKLHDEGHGLGIITVDVEDRGVDGLGDIGTVRSRATKAGVGGETDLVVDNDVDGTTGGVGREVVEAHGLVDNALASKGGITVHENSHRVLALSVLAVELQGTGLAEHDRVDSLQMGRVGDERKVDALTRGGRTDIVHTQMVLDITRTFLGGLKRAAELAKDGLVGLTDHVAEDVETTTMGHTNHDRLDTKVDGAVNLNRAD